MWQAEPRKTFGSLEHSCAKQRLTVGGKRPDDDGPRNDVSNNDGRSRIWLWVYALFSKLKNYHHENKLKVVEASDRLHLFADGSLQTIQYQENLGEEDDQGYARERMD